ncbi:MAG: hypothetical protein Harvfovirus59_5 [Harvfovirus sp.]|uniref:Uncharacterized protein n=1 Tax=Harvfovirus sp. TaxID=2487768 RepID=A0A3G5A3K5_9VIRU|nr:MAG: hypothetical protein Harvfovirus59_5 [Harvfovirus sp.]
MLERNCCDSIEYIECQIVKINIKIEKIIGVLGKQDARIKALVAKVGDIQTQLNDLMAVVGTQGKEIADLTGRVNNLAMDVSELQFDVAIQAANILALQLPTLGQFPASLNSGSLIIFSQNVPPIERNIGLTSPDSDGLIISNPATGPSSSGIYQCFYSLDVTNATTGVDIFYKVLIIIDSVTVFTSGTTQNTVNNNLLGNPELKITIPEEGVVTLQVELVTTGAVDSVVLPSSYVNLHKISD